MSEPEKNAPEDQYWWTPWAVLVGLCLYGLLGFLGVLTPKQKGPTAADVPTQIASAAPTPSAAAAPARPPH